MEAESGFCDADDVADAQSDDGISDSYAADAEATIQKTEENLELEDMSASASLPAEEENAEEENAEEENAEEENDEEADSNNLLEDDEDTPDAEATPDAETTSQDIVGDDDLVEDGGHVTTSQQASGEEAGVEAGVEEGVEASEEASEEAVEAGASSNLQHLNQENVNKRIPKNVQDTMRMAQSWYGDLNHDEGRTLRKRPNPTPGPSGTAKKRRD